MKRSLAVSIFLTLAIPLLQSAHAETTPIISMDHPQEYQVFEDGEPVSVEVFTMRRGSNQPPLTLAILREEYPILFDGPGRYELDADDEGFAWLKGTNGLRQKCVAVTDMLNPLGDMSPEKIGRLGGVYIGKWYEGLENKLQWLNFDRAFVYLENCLDDNTNTCLPPLPPDIRFLYLSCRTENVALSGFEKLTNLRVLFIQTVVGPLDFSDFKNHDNLIFLSICDVVGKIQHATISQIRPLQGLRLPHREDLTDLSFISSLSNLNVLDISGSNIEDLSPIAQVPQLHTALARDTKVRKLPQEKLTTLKYLDVMGTPLSTASFNRFSTFNPQARLLHRWEQAMAGYLSKADKIVILEKKGETQLKEVTSQDVISEISSIITVDPNRPLFHYPCETDLLLDFYLGEQILERLTWTCGGKLYCTSFTPQLVYLSIESDEQLCRWFDRNGVAWPLVHLKQRISAKTDSTGR